MTPVIHRGIPGKYRNHFSKYVPFPIEPIGFYKRNYFADWQIRFLCIGKLVKKEKNIYYLLMLLKNKMLIVLLLFWAQVSDMALRKILL